MTTELDNPKNDDDFCINFATLARKVWFCKTEAIICEFASKALLFSLASSQHKTTAIKIKHTARAALFKQTWFVKVEFKDVCLGSTSKTLLKPKVYFNWKYLFAYNGKVFQHNRYGFLGKASGWISRKGEDVDFIHVTRFDPETLPAFQVNHSEYWKPESCTEISGFK